MKFEYQPRGVCSRLISFEVEDNIVRRLEFTGGCSGNAQGLSRLVEGMDIDEVIRRVRGIRCGFKPTSCPDQLSQALSAAKEQLAQQAAGT
ncbi:MAG: TIGR03905 family TSCPD domain-containing protein [Oscillospiraceae bacterium]|nr:TIGR03905 family TSCPD domain-containing protein [Oscillospiraceae bacterium]